MIVDTIAPRTLAALTAEHYCALVRISLGRGPCIGMGGLIVDPLGANIAEFIGEVDDRRPDLGHAAADLFETGAA